MLDQYLANASIREKPPDLNRIVCMSTKIVHLELITSLSAEAFLATLRCFIAHRGYTIDIYFDDGRNFVGPNSHLKFLIDISRSEAVEDLSSAKAIT